MSLGFYNFESDLSYQDNFIKLQLDISNKNILKDYLVSGSINEEIILFLNSSFDSLKSSKSEVLKSLKLMIDKTMNPSEKYLLWLVYQKVFFFFYSEQSLLAKDYDLKDALFCRCMGLKESLIKETIKKENVRDMFSLTNHIGVGAGCGSCVDSVMKTFGLEARLYEENDNSMVSVSRDKRRVYQHEGRSFNSANLLLEILFPLFEKEDVEIVSLVEDHLYIKTDKNLNEMGLNTIIQKLHLKVIKV